MGQRRARARPYLVAVIDVNTAATVPPPLWEPGTPRRPSLIPAALALVLLAVTSTVVVIGLYRALEVRYTPRADTCAGLDVGAFATLTKGPRPVTRPGRTPRSCAFVVGTSAGGSLSTTYTTSAFEVRLLAANTTTDDARQAVTGIGQGAWVSGDATIFLSTCRYAAQAWDVNLVIHLDLQLVSPYCEPVAVRAALADSLRATFARLV
jgi:hypothetical protein